MNSICDLHTHSVLSLHAYSSVTENIEYANSIGLKYYGISEHQYDDVGVGAHRYAFHNLKVIPSVYKGTHILKGVELNILDDGVVDFTKHELGLVDYAIASMHSYVYSSNHTYEENTQNYLNVLDIPQVKILGHIDNGIHPCDFEKVIKKVIEKNKLIEINSSSVNPKDSRMNSKENIETILKIMMKYDYPIIINSDAHIKYMINDFSFVEPIIEKVGFPKDKILNYNEELFLKYFGNVIKEV